MAKSKSVRGILSAKTKAALYIPACLKLCFSQTASDAEAFCDVCSRFYSDNLAAWNPLNVAGKRNVKRRAQQSAQRDEANG